MSKKARVITGTAATAVFILLVFGIYIIKKKASEKNTVVYYAIFDQVSTLSIGDQVKINGVSLGRVDAVELWQNKVRIKLKVKRSFEDVNGTENQIRIPVDSKVYVQNTGLMGERQIEIRLGTSEKFYLPGDIIQKSYFDASMGEVMEKAANVLKSGEKIAQDVHDVFDSTIGSREFAASFKNIVKDTRRMTKNLGKLIDEIDPELKSYFTRIEKLKNEMELFLSDQKNSIDTIARNNVKIKQKANEVEKLLKSLADEVSILIQSDKSTAKKTINDFRFQENLKSSVSKADSLMVILKKKGIDLNVDFF